MIFPFVTVVRESKTILSAALFEVDESFNFEDLLYQADSDYVSGEIVKVDIQNEQLVSSASQIPSTSNVFNEIMNAATRKSLPNLKLTTNRNDRLYNDLLALLGSNNLDWEYGTHNSVGKSFINQLVSLLYYLDDKHATLKLRSLNIPSIFLQLPLYQQNSYYKNGSHHKTTLSHKELEFYADKLEECVLEPWASKACWDQFVTASLELCSVARAYANYLKTVNQHVQKIQSASSPARSPENDSTLEMRPSCLFNDIQEIYVPVAEQIRVTDEYEKIYICEGVLRHLYHNLTGDSSAFDNARSEQVDQRIKMVLELGNPEIIIDLRKNNGFKETKFNEF
ncbi:11023_t:CDS:2 [Racocetra fulgida]|uniref:11023_t:CDS:1 n=1 Tax=Racocetra fulgida TaxID=60492 RepID=A0A9N8VTT7_9GLOM|nr:11023_t:CDS:2 [Racocetra fulgida]